MGAIDFRALKNIDVREVAKRLQIRLTRGGRGGYCPGPNHGSGKGGASLAIFDDRFHCFGASCGAHGDAVDLVQLAQGCSTKEAINWLNSQNFAIPVRDAERLVERKLSLDIPSGRATVMGEIWKAVRSGWSDDAHNWVDGRGIDPEIAWDAGCRDFGPAMPEIKRILEQHPPELLRASGLADHEGKFWFPLRRAFAGKPVPGLAFPVHVPGHPHPVGWRWRFYTPFPVEDGVIKCADQPSPGYAWAAPPLGLAYPDPPSDQVVVDHVDPDGKRRRFATQEELDRLPPGYFDEPPNIVKSRVRPISASDTVILTEGEPDWLSVLDVVGTRAAVLGFTAISRGWASPWTPLIGDRRVVVLTHDKSQPFVQQLMSALAERYGVAHVHTHVSVSLLPESADANDMLQRSRSLLLQHANAALAGVGR